MSDLSLKEGRIIKGFITTSKPFGVFISIPGHPNEGLCHFSEIGNEVDIRRGNDVFVQVLRLTKEGKLSLSIKNVDQKMGVLKEGVGSPYSNSSRDTHNSNIKPSINTGFKRRNDMDAWEQNQINSAFGAKKRHILREDSEDPYAEVDSDENEEQNNEEIEVQLNRDVPTFLNQYKDQLLRKNTRNSKNDRNDRNGQKRVLNNRNNNNTANHKNGNNGQLRAKNASMTDIADAGSQLMKENKNKKREKRLEEEKKRREMQKSKYLDDPLMNKKIEEELKKEEIEEMEKNAIIEWKKEARVESYGIKSKLSMQEQRESLPVYKSRNELLEAVRNNDFIVIVGETGSGKTTQITQYLAEDGYINSGIIACTQPRRVAAISVAKRVAEEVNCKVGDEVGYTIRFEDCTGPQTKIKYMTDGMLEREALTDPLMSRYSVIMLDEAHERTIATDILFALLRDIVIKRKGTLKLIVTSATLDSTKFSRYFNNCPVFHIQGRTFPVKIYYTKTPELDYIEATIDTIIDVHTNNPKGDILVFLTGREEIETCCEAIVQKMSVLYQSDPSLSELIVLPIYSAMPSEMQSRIFEPTPKGKRKVVIATNIAETSITIDGIYYVVDPGFVKVNAYDPKRGMDTLVVKPISRAQADQRSGRAGRTGPGICYRLYTKNAYLKEMPANTTPEILRQNLSHTILMLKAMGINDVLEFGFMDRPKEESLVKALEELYILEALDEDGKLTETGRCMAYFAVEPMLSKTLIKSFEFGCSYEVIEVIAMLTVPDVFYRPREKRDLADKMKQRFDDFNGDHLTLLNVYRKWEASGYSKDWCTDNFIQEKSMRKARDVKNQLIRLMEIVDKKEKGIQLSLVSCKNRLEQVRKAFVSGFFKNCAKRSSNHGHHDEEGVFRTLADNLAVYIHPSSSLFKIPGVDYVIYHTLVLTNKEYMHCTTKIDPSWLIQYASKVFRKTERGELSIAKKREKIQPLYDKFDQTGRWRLSRGRR
ncbi:DEAH-box ATP-dependent RNA helicase prp22 [Pichia californica]|uniref:RNA helicase n=1 Tax=Pichia californica TaxID=460514 RepID=A0A9P7BG90_9ASCO|nr:DEAH-box ATP-dependent RNA helicase prp22 [[Candida] californica]KAG0689731.1 DEAH-box ATP-dependent RNA helicase prp22 [[Candida] californica]